MTLSLTHSKKYDKRKILVLVAFLTCFTSLHAQTPTFEWAKVFGNSTGTLVATALGNSIVVDASGNSYCTGWFDGTVDFDPGTGVENMSAGSPNNMFILKLNPSGNFVWVKCFGDTSTIKSLSLSSDSSGNIYATGCFNGIVDFDPGAGVFNLNSSNENVFVLKLDLNGNFVWAKSIGSATGYFESPTIHADQAGNSHITGTFSGTGDFDPGTGTSIHSNLTGFPSSYILKLDALGNFNWVKHISGNQSVFSTSINTDRNGDVIVVGGFQDTADFDPGVGTSILVGSGYSNVFILKLSSSGNYLWARNVGGSESDLAVSVVSDPNGNIYTSGTFLGTVDFDPGPGMLNLTSGYSVFPTDVFILKLDENGELVWAKNLTISSCHNYYPLALDPSNDVYMCGDFKEVTDFNPGAGIYNLCPLAPIITDMFILKLNQNGDFIWVKNVGGNEHVSGSSIVIGNDYSIYTTGAYSGITDFDPDSGIYNVSALNPYSMFVHKLSIPNTNQSTTITNEFNISLYPNPAHTNFTITSNYTGAYELTIFDQLGQPVMVKNCDKTVETIQTSNLHSGVYFVQLSINGATKTAKLIIR